MKRFQCGVLVTAVLVLGVMGCSPQSPEDRVASIRARYKATLTGFIVQEEPVELAAEPVVDLLGAPNALDSVSPGGLDEMPLDDGAGPSDLDDIPTYSVSTQVLLDLLVQNNSSEKLAGITVDVSMVDSQQREKGHWRVWFDTSTIEKANAVARTHTLEDPGYEEGDGFAAEVRRVPESERSEYKEFSPAQ